VILKIHELRGAALSTEQNQDPGGNGEGGKNRARVHESDVHDARTFIEEQGVSILYLALGFLKWYEAPSSDKARFAPLLLVPVDLERPSATSRFRLKFREEDIVTNLSLQAKLQKEFQVALPDVIDSDEFSPQAYFDAVTKIIGVQPRWEVRPNEIVLWFFSFAKYLMYRDLDAENWPEHAPLKKNSLLSTLLQDGFPNDPPLCGENEKIDELILPADMVHVTDADSSQALVIEEVRRGRSLVVQGPPGTGKSQTITNMIAAAVKDGKTVLFVAEKLAALNVVKSRLDRHGLGPICLELHSHSANKKKVAEELSRTLGLGRPAQNGFANTIDALRHVRERLNQHAALMNTPLEPSGRTPFQILGRLVALNASGAEPVDFKLGDPVKWSRRDFEEKCGLLDDLLLHVRNIGVPLKSPWRGVALESPPLPSDVKQWLSRVTDAQRCLDELRETAQNLARLLGIQEQQSMHLRAIQALHRLICKFREAPPMDRRKIANPVWVESSEAINGLVQDGQALESCRSRLTAVVSEAAWDLDMAPVCRELAAHGRSWVRWLRRSYRDAVATLRGVMEKELPKANDERLAIADTLQKARKLVASLDDEAKSARVGRDAFGARWNGSRSNWAELASIATWERDCRTSKLPKFFRQIFSRISDLECCVGHTDVLSERLQRVESSLPAIFQFLCFDFSEAFGTQGVDLIPLDQLCDLLRAWGQNGESLSKWVACWMRLVHLRSGGLAPADAAMALPQPASFIDCRIESRVLRQQPVRHPQSGKREQFERVAVPIRRRRGLRPRRHCD
jgi:hypothetical protein